MATLPLTDLHASTVLHKGFIFISGFSFKFLSHRFYIKVDFCFTSIVESTEPVMGLGSMFSSMSSWKTGL